MDFVASFVNQSRLPPAHPRDVLELHQSKRSPAEHPIEDAWQPASTRRIGKTLPKVATYVDQLDTSVAQLVDAAAASSLVPAGHP